MATSKLNDIDIANVSKVKDIDKTNIAKISDVEVEQEATFSDSYALSKTISTGTSNAVYLVDNTDAFNFVGGDAWTISFWVKAGWSSSLNTHINFIIGHKNETSYQLEDCIKILYNEPNNRLWVRYGNKTSSTLVWYKDAQWLFHANSGAYAAGYQAAGLGSTYWSASNRGYTGDNDFTMITITKASTNVASSLKLYWNANSAGAAPLQTNAGGSDINTIPMSATDDRLWSVGSRGKYASVDQDKSGNSSATQYNDLTIWNKELSSSEVTSLYNSGTRMDATTHSASANLKGYYKFENDGTDSSGNSNPSFTVAGGSGFVSI
jgi:hypothetical protein